MRSPSSHPSLRALPWVAVVAATVALAALVALVLAGADDAAPTVLRVQQIVCALVVAVVAWRRRRTEPDSGWIGIAVFAAVWATDRVLVVVLDPGAPLSTRTGWWNLVWVVGLPAGFYGLFRLCFGRLSGATRWRVVFDALLVGSAFCFSGWVVIRATLPSVVAGMEPTGLFSPAIEVVAASIILTAAVYQPRRAPLWWLAAAAFLATVADLALLHESLTDGNMRGGLLYLPFVLAPLMAVGLVLSSDDVARPADIGSRRRMLLYSPVALAVGLAAWEVARTGALTGEVAVLAVVLGAMVVMNFLSVLSEMTGTLDRLRASEDLFRTVFDAAPLGVVIGDAEGRLLSVNRRLTRLTGVPPEVLVGGRLEDYATGPVGAEHARLRGELLAGRRRSFVQDFTVRVRDELRHMHLEVVPLPALDPPGLLGLLEDTTDRHRAQQELSFLANHDPLTGLPNRASFERRLSAELARVAATPGRRASDVGRRPPPVAVAFVDLDQFKVVNDSLGHVAGDELLVACGRRLVEAAGADAYVARFGGDEFCVLFPSEPRAQHRDRLDRVVEALRYPVEVGGEVSYPTASIGVALSRPEATASDLLAEADAAMYRAKERGRNRVEWFRSDDVPVLTRAHRLVGELHQVLRHAGEGDAGELVVHFQPMVALDTGLTAGAEALVRWRHPERGLMAPADFLDLADGAGLMVELGEWVLRSACATAATWTPAQPGRPRPWVSVNVAAQQLAGGDFVALVAEVLAQTGLPAGDLWLEITESALMADTRAATRTLTALRGLGVHLSIDDFGTGYSSLTYLRRFPVQALKIDRSFVDGIGVADEDSAIVRALCDLGDQLGLRVVAEGIETPLQMELLRAWGCDTGQGFLFGRPVPADELEAVGVRAAR
ncbi:MAG: putative bifunctional diguanylate cyclase/phosphodiesterase [Microthrixaceae bacterium]